MLKTKMCFGFLYALDHGGVLESNLFESENSLLALNTEAHSVIIVPVIDIWREHISWEVPIIIVYVCMCM